MVRSTIILASAAILCCVAIVLVGQAMDDATEVSRVSNFFPCWMMDSCKLPTEEEATVQRWQGSGVEARNTLPCGLGGDCALPEDGAVNRWNTEEESSKTLKREQDEGIAERNGLKMPPQEGDAAWKVDHGMISDATVQKEMQHDLLTKAKERAAFISSNPADPNVKPSSGHGEGKGLLSNGTAKVQLLKDHPNSQKQIGGIMGKVKEAEQARKEAVAAIAKAAKLEADAAVAQDTASKQSAQADEALKQAQSDQEAHDTAAQDVEALKSRVRKESAVVTAAKHAVQLNKQVGAQASTASAPAAQAKASPAPSIKAAPAAQAKTAPVQVPQGKPGALLASGWADDVVPEASDVTQGRELQDVEHAAEALLAKYDDSQRSYKEAKAQTARQALRLKRLIQEAEGAALGQ